MTVDEFPPCADCGVADATIYLVLRDGRRLCRGCWSRNTRKPAPRKKKSDVDKEKQGVLLVHDE